jgi:oligopeptide transport system permease protein
MFFVLVIVTTLTFFLVYSIPGDPVSAMVDKLPESTRLLYLNQYGFDQPLPVQYVRFVKQLFQGDLGSSLRYPGRKVMDIIAAFSPVSALLGGVSLGLGFLTGIILGITAALYRNKWPDKVIMVLAILGTTIPTFVTASLLQYFFTVTWRFFPTVGWGGVRFMVLPVICLCANTVASYARYMRSCVLDVNGQDYILTAEAKGAGMTRIILHHILRNSFLPCITMLCTSVGAIFSGSFIVESIFSIPGLGKYFISSINDRDYSVVLGLTLIFTGVYALSILVSDILMCLIDPRIRLTGSTS